jgi:hypothetical protein
VIVDLTVKNIGDGSDENSFLQRLNPGSSEKARLVYDVPEKVELVGVDLQGRILSQPAHVILSDG